jgi:hypothetical protein
MDHEARVNTALCDHGQMDLTHARDTQPVYGSRAVVRQDRAASAGEQSARSAAYAGRAPAATSE